jgi:uncharacterized coiled-coil protein SlyX
MSDALMSSQQAEINRLNAQLAEARSEAAQRRKAGASLKKQLAELTASNQALTAERDDFKAKSEATPEETRKTIEGLTSRLRDRVFRDAFAAEASKGDEKGAGKINPDAVDAAWKLMEFKPESDDVDPAKIKELVAKARTGHGYLFSQAADAATKGETKGEGLTPGPGSQRGATGATAGTVKRSDMRNAQWMFANQARAAEAVKAGLVVED